MGHPHLLERVFDIPTFRGRAHVFDSRADAGEVLAGMLRSLTARPAIVLAIPAGGVPVGAIVARHLEAPLDVAVVSKITLPWDTEMGYGAAAFDGAVQLNEEMLPHLHLTPAEIDEGTRRAVEKVRRRLHELRGDLPMPDLSGQTAILVDDGLASGFTMQVAIEAVARLGCAHIVLAVPTAHDRAIRRLVAQQQKQPRRLPLEAIYCPNIRTGLSFAVADAYRNWSDVPEGDLPRLLEPFHLAWAR